MRYKLSSCKQILVLIFGLTGYLGYFPTTAQTATLDDLYQQIIDKDQLLWTTEISHFQMWEQGYHGSASFNYFESNPSITRFNNVLRASPKDGWEARLGYNYTFPDRYERLTENNANTIASFQTYKLRNHYDFNLQTRYRSGFSEWYLDVLEKRYKTYWNFATSRGTKPIFPNYFKSHYEDIKIGWRWLNRKTNEQDQGSPQHATVGSPMMEPRQLNVEGQLRYRNGKLTRSAIFHLSDTQRRRYFHKTDYHFTPGVLLHYGLTPKIEIESGLNYTSPFTYLFDFSQTKDSGLQSGVNGIYKFDNAFEVPLQVRFKQKENIEWLFSSDYSFIHQNLAYRQLVEGGTVNTFPDKKLKYFNVVPTLQWKYASIPESTPKKTEITPLTKQLLAKNQISFSLLFRRDISSLKKNSDSGTQNIADPYNIYLYPSEFFVAGTEYAAFFSGNTANTPANVPPQNYHQLQANVSYGLKDNVEIGLGAGYRSKSTVHQFSLVDLGDRFFIFKPYYYIDLKTDWYVNKDSLLSFQVHFVPDYKTEMLSSAHPEAFSAETRYIEASLKFQKLF